MRRAALLLVLAALAAAACKKDDPAVKADPGGVPAGPERPLLPVDRLELPELDLAGYRALVEEVTSGGTPLVVNIWGSWCPPCRVEAPDLAKVAREFEGRVQFLGVDILDQREAARDFILEFDWQYPHVFDPTGAIRDGLGYIGQPITIVHDTTGAVAFEWSGTLTADMLRGEIRKVL